MINCMACFSVKGFYRVTVEASSVTGARLRASEKWVEADFGQLGNCDAEIVDIDEDGAGEYTVVFAVFGSALAEATGPTEKETLRIASDEVMTEKDFGELKDIEWEVNYASFCSI